MERRLVMRRRKPHHIKILRIVVVFCCVCKLMCIVVGQEFSASYEESPIYIDEGPIQAYEDPYNEELPSDEFVEVEYSDDPQIGDNEDDNKEEFLDELPDTRKKEKDYGDTIFCTDGLLLHAWRPLDDVSMIERILRGIIYFVVMCYLFLGVSIVVDRFMQSIEMITSTERYVTVQKKNGEREVLSVRVWNETVANLTLMAFGSSSPAILLCLIEMFQKSFNAGGLGPGTIVGAAAYDLFVIVALAMVVVPLEQTRRVNDLRVYSVMLLWALIAYVWIYIIIAVISPNVIEIWESVLTFAFFPLTVYHAYMAERNLLCYRLCGKSFRSKNQDIVVSSSGINESEENMGLRSSIKDLSESPGMRDFEDLRRDYLTQLKELRRKYPEVELDKLEIMAQEQLIKKSPKSRAFYRIQATRRMVGANNVLNKAHDKAELQFEDFREYQNNSDIIGLDEDEIDDDDDVEAQTHIFFNPAHYTVMESVGEFPVRVMRSGDLSQVTKVKYYTEDGTAEAGNDYVATSGELIFGPGMEEQRIMITIINDDEFEQEEHFYIQLGQPTGAAVLKIPKVATVMILDDDHCGIFGFESEKIQVSEAIGVYQLKVRRYYGARLKVTVPYRMEEVTAIPGKDYISHRGQIVFQPDETVQVITIQLIDGHSFKKKVFFNVYLDEPFLDADDPLGAEMRATKGIPIETLEGRAKNLAMALPKLSNTSKVQITIIESEKFKQTVNKLVQTANASQLIGTSSWKEQFMDALTVAGHAEDDDHDEDDRDDMSENEDDDKEPSYWVYVMHFLTLFWKITFAIIPPSKYCKGYLCFFVSLLLIALTTAVLGDVALHFGCTLGILDLITAICFVAVGTSLPDTFANRVAAVSDHTADSSVGSIIGSIAVNAYLGIGVAWLMASIYHATQGSTFVVPYSTLGFPMLLFLVEYVIAIVLLVFRRKSSIGGELGGPRKEKWFHASILWILWLFFLTLSILGAYKIISF